MTPTPSAGKFFAQIPYDRNSTLHLIMGIGSLYIIMHIVYVVFIILSSMPGTVYNELMLPNTAIKDWEHFLEKPWTLFIYGLSHNAFWIMFTNMLWLYLFGNVLQQYVGHQEIIPIYILMYIISGFLYLLFTIIIPTPSFTYFQGALVSNIGIATAAMCIQPQHKMRLGNSLQIPFYIFYIIFLMLNIILLISNANAYGLVGKLLFTYHSYTWILFLVSAATGVAYAMMCKKGVRIGNFFYNSMHQLVAIFTPKTNADGWRTDKLKNAIAAQDRFKNNPELHALLDKLEKEGIKSLSPEERIQLFG